MIDDITLGRIAYEAYAEVESETGLIAIPWGDELADSVKSWWQTGAEAVAAHLGALECTPLPAPQPERELAAVLVALARLNRGTSTADLVGMLARIYCPEKLRRRHR